MCRAFLALLSDCGIESVLFRRISITFKSYEMEIWGYSRIVDLELGYRFHYLKTKTRRTIRKQERREDCREIYAMLNFMCRSDIWYYYVPCYALPNDENRRSLSRFFQKGLFRRPPINSFFSIRILFVYNFILKFGTSMKFCVCWCYFQ